MPRARHKPHTLKSKNPKIRAEFRKARLALGKTQKDMALELGFIQAYVRFVENGYVNPSMKRIIAFETYLKKTARTLFPDLYSEASRVPAE